MDRTKTDLRSFQDRKNRWQTAPRPKVVRLQAMSTKLEFDPPIPSPSFLTKKTMTMAQQQQQQMQQQKQRPTTTTTITTTTPTMMGSTNSIVSTGTDYRTRLVDFYNQYNPDKVRTVDTTLGKYRGKEEELFQKLYAKYRVRGGGTTGGDSPGSPAASPFLLPSGDGPLCYLEFSIDGTLVGRVVVKLYQDRAPLATENFRCLCTGERGTGRQMKPLYYAGHHVHRIVPMFVVQMGDFTRGDGRGGESIYPPHTDSTDSMGRFRDDVPYLQHSRGGLLSMANSGKDTNNSQFFFTLRPAHHLDGKHVVFGEVVSGMDIIRSIGDVPTDPKDQRPLQPVVIEACGEIKG